MARCTQQELYLTLAAMYQQSVMLGFENLPSFPVEWIGEILEYLDVYDQSTRNIRFPLDDFDSLEDVPDNMGLVQKNGAMNPERNFYA